MGAKCEQQDSASDEPVVLVFRHLEREWQLPFRTSPPRMWAPSANSKVRLVEPSGVQALKNPNPLKDVEGQVVLVVIELS